MTQPTHRGKAEKAAISAVASVAGPVAALAAGLGLTAGKTLVSVLRSKAFTELVLRDPEFVRALLVLLRRGEFTGTRSRKISTRVDPAVMEAAKRRFGLTNDADVINASLAMAAAPDRFKTWLDRHETVSDDFEPAV